MKATAGESRSRPRGYAILLVIFVMAGLTVTGLVLMPGLVQPQQGRIWNEEEKTLDRLAKAFERTVEIRQTIPAATNWAGLIGGTIGLTTNQVQQVWPEFPGDTNARRILLLDPLLTASVLPYVQNTNGLINAQTNLMGTNGRALIISSTKRDLALPVSGGVASSQSVFNSIWNWAYDPVTQAPPSGWPAAWNGNADHLHVQAINLANLFQTVTLSNVQYSLNNSSTFSIISLKDRYFLRGGLISVHTRNGTFLAKRVINRNLEFLQPDPCPWTSADIGTVNASGSTSCGGTNILLTGSGSGFATTDEFQFGYQNSTGDTEITARLTSLTPAGTSLSEAGVMLRATALANSDYLAVSYRDSRRIYLRYRYAGTVSSTLVNIAVDPPVWLRISRTGNTFYAGYSLNGTSWTTLLNASASGPGYTLTGLTATSNNDGDIATAAFDNITIVQ